VTRERRRATAVVRAVAAVAVVALAGALMGSCGDDERAPVSDAASSASLSPSSSATAPAASATAAVKEYVDPDWGLRFMVGDRLDSRAGPVEALPGIEAVVFTNGEAPAGWASVTVLRLPMSGELRRSNLLEQLSDPRSGIVERAIARFGEGTDVEIERAPTLTTVGSGWVAVSAEYSMTLPAETAAQRGLPAGSMWMEVFFVRRGDWMFEVGLAAIPADVFGSWRNELELTPDTLSAVE